MSDIISRVLDTTKKKDYESDYKDMLDRISDMIKKKDLESGYKYMLDRFHNDIETNFHQVFKDASETVKLMTDGAPLEQELFKDTVYKLMYGFEVDINAFFDRESDKRLDKLKKLKQGLKKETE